MPKRKQNSSGNPSTVLAAFASETEFSLSLDGWLLLEALDSPFTNQGKPGLGDVLLAALVMTDEAAVIDARKKRQLDSLLRTATKGKRPADVIPLTSKITAAIEAAFAPADSGADAEKKS